MVDIVLLQGVVFDEYMYVGCVGFEDRSTAFLRDTALIGQADVLLFDYESVNLFSYERNMDIVSSLEAEVYSEFAEFLEAFVRRCQEGSPKNVVFDITSFDREKIAAILVEMFRVRADVADMKIVYMPREFEPVELKFDVVQSFGPVSREFLGEVTLARRSMTLILGAGYEFGKAVGAIDTLEPDEIYCFRPTGTDPEFDRFIDLANIEFSFMDNKENIFYYDVKNASTLYFDLRRLVQHEISERNILILPLGPKIFAAVSMLVGLIFHPSVMVWRHSTASVVNPRSLSDARATGVVVELPFRFLPEE